MLVRRTSLYLHILFLQVLTAVFQHILTVRKTTERYHVNRHASFTCFVLCRSCRVRAGEISESSKTFRLPPVEEGLHTVWATGGRRLVRHV